MLPAELAATSEAVAAASSRLAKIQTIAGCLQAEAAVAVCSPVGRDAPAAHRRRLALRTVPELAVQPPTNAFTNSFSTVLSSLMKERQRRRLPLAPRIQLTIVLGSAQVGLNVAPYSVLRKPRTGDDPNDS
jgi:hypothetical protein